MSTNMTNDYKIIEDVIHEGLDENNEPILLRFVEIGFGINGNDDNRHLYMMFDSKGRLYYFTTTIIIRICDIKFKYNETNLLLKKNVGAYIYRQFIPFIPTDVTKLEHDNIIIERALQEFNNNEINFPSFGLEKYELK